MWYWFIAAGAAASAAAVAMWRKWWRGRSLIKSVGHVTRARVRDAQRRAEWSDWKRRLDERGGDDG